jgi:two-component system nitrate/nitrite response regulator NarL
MDCRMGMPLSMRDKQIVRGLMDGLTNRQIARRLFLAEGTIKVYLSKRIGPKLGVSSRLQIAAWGFKNGLGEANEFSS